MAKFTLLALAALLVCSQVILAQMQMPDISSLMGGMGGGGGSNPMSSLLSSFGGMGGNSNNYDSNGQYPNENLNTNYNGCPSQNQQCQQCQQQVKVHCNRNSCPGNQVCCKVNCCTKKCVRYNNGK